MTMYTKNKCYRHSERGEMPCMDLVRKQDSSRKDGEIQRGR